LVPLAANPMSGGVNCPPSTVRLSPSPSAPDSGVPGVTVVNAAAVAVPPGAADAGLEDDRGPQRSGMRTVRCAEGKYLGSALTFTVPARATDPECEEIVLAAATPDEALGEAAAWPAREPTTPAAARATAAPKLIVRFTNPP